MTYFKLLAKQVRMRVIVWLAILCGMSIGFAPVFGGLYSTEEELRSIEMTLDNPAMIALVGPIPDAAYTTAISFSHQMFLFMALVHGIFGILIANAVSRKAEDDGLTEYLVSGGVKKSTLYFNQVMLGVLINALAGVINYAGLSLMNLESFNNEGNLLYSAGLALFGMLFYMLTIFVGTLVSSADFTFGISLGALVIMFLYRAVTDVADMAYSVISPYNWLSRMYPYAEDNFVWLLPFLSIIVFAAAGWFLFANRDIGGAYLKARGRKRTRKIRTYPGLALRSMRTMIISWLAGLFVIGLTYGAIFGDLETMISENEMLSAAVEAGAIDDPVLFFINMILIITTVIATIPGVMIIGRILREEDSARLEVVNTGTLERRFSRSLVLLTHWGISLIVALLGMVLTTLGMYLASMNVDDIGIGPGDYMLASVNYFSVIAAAIGLGALLLGLSKGLFKVIWLYVGYMFFVAYLGNLVELHDAFHMLTPFHYVENVPINDMDWLAFAGVSVVSVLLFIAGMLLYRRRDLG
ncbi:ABC transporter permease [Lacicoccus alkaliphilus]|uniref:ABC-2 type transport system permease protein n=1 Tax=Lacicoccus alkaliphilus DSM 16010 TaxID=1123231 RepID=A0A1M7G475_9BACL|nr:hypothetical protein [Salinicoccus alkaliphilus]SHM11174.1 ABC-2 type transport system permease protein [Salinicoccus alkaliphilus DSM 16010]